MERIGFIGGSDAYAACGDDPKVSRLTLYYEKIGEVQPEDISERDEIRSGVLAEPIIAKEFEARSKYPVTPGGDLIMSSEYPWMGAHIDFYVTLPDGTRTFLECKNTSFRNYKDWQGEGNIPERYLYQIHHYMIVLKLDYCFIGAWIGGGRFVFKKIPRNLVVSEYIIKQEKEFWDMVVSRNAPPLTVAVQDDPTLARRFYPQSHGFADIDLTPVSEYVEKAYALQRELKEVKSRLDSIRAIIRVKMGTVPKGHTDKHKVIFTSRDMTILDEKKLRKELPHVYKKYLKTTQVRPMQVYETHESEELTGINLNDGEYAQIDAFHSDFS